MSVSEGARAQKPRQNWRPLGASFDALIRAGGLIAAIIIVAVVFDIFNAAFLSIDVAISVLRSMCSVAILGLGLTLVIICGEIDLSIGAMYGFASNLLAVTWVLGGISIYLSLILTLVAGAAIGVCNGILTTKARIPSFIVTLGSYNLLYGLSLFVTHAATFNPAYPPDGSHVAAGQLNFFTGLTRQLGGHQFSAEIFWMIGAAVVVGLILHRSLFGFRLYAIGGNAVAARLARLPVDRYKILAFSAAGLLAAIAGILDFSFVQTTQPDVGLSQTFPVFAAVVIGGASLSGGKGSVIGTIGGAFLLAELQTGLAVLSPGPYAQQIFLGVVTVGAVGLDIALNRLRARRAV
jgi:ribose/xylose/arabinose/galactoside ABC-type transport system permease subunit